MRISVVAMVMACTSLTTAAQDQGFTCRSNHPAVLQRMETERPGFTERAMQARHDRKHTGKAPIGAEVAL